MKEKDPSLYADIRINTKAEHYQEEEFASADNRSFPWEQQASAKQHIKHSLETERVKSQDKT